MDISKLNDALAAVRHAATLYELSANRQRSGDTARSAYLRAAADRLLDHGLQRLKETLDAARQDAQRNESAPLPTVTRGDSEGWPLGHKALWGAAVRP